MKTKFVKISEVKQNPNNPRTIRDDKFERLVTSIKAFPEMLNIRPIVVNSDMVVLGGNMRLKACRDAGIKEVPIIIADELSESQQREFIIKDNIGFGDWDWQLLNNDWDNEQLEEWGLDIPDFEVNNSGEDESVYSTKVEAPVYEPSNEKPLFKEVYEDDKFNELIKEIENSSLEKQEKEFLKLCASRHIVFNYKKIADIYANSGEEMQKLMENSALVIIDYDKAIEKGFVEITEHIDALEGEE